MDYQNIRPEDWKYAQYGYEAVDLPVLLRIRYTGTQVAAHVTLAATTGDMTFEQGATTGDAATTTGSNPIAPVGGTVGVIDASDSEVDTLAKLLGVINHADDWEAWAVDLPGDESVEISAGNAIYLTTLADQDCTGANGFAVLVDTELKTAEDFAVGISFNGPSTGIHNHDANVLHQILKINANITMAGTPDGVYIYECNDITGTKTQVWHRALATATATEFATSGQPIISTTGRRLVVMAKTSGAITVPSLLVSARSYAFGPAIRHSKTWAELSV